MSIILHSPCYGPLTIEPPRAASAVQRFIEIYDRRRWATDIPYQDIMAAWRAARGSVQRLHNSANILADLDSRMEIVREWVRKGL